MGSSADPIMDVAIDDERDILYTLSQSSSIQMYDLHSADGEGITFIQSVGLSDLVKNLESILRGCAAHVTDRPCR